MPQEVRAFLEKCLLKIEAVQLLLRRFGLCGSLSTKGAKYSVWRNREKCPSYPAIPSQKRIRITGIWTLVVELAGVKKVMLVPLIRALASVHCEEGRAWCNWIDPCWTSIIPLVMGAAQGQLRPNGHHPLRDHAICRRTVYCGGKPICWSCIRKFNRRG